MSEVSITKPEGYEVRRFATHGSDWTYLPPDIQAAVRELHTFYAGELFRPSRWEAARKVTAHLVKLLREGFSCEDKDAPYAFLQWKGTDACFDFHCKCGAFCHWDGYFAYYVQCPHCKATYQMPFNLFPREVTQTEGHEPKVLQPDEECKTEPPQEEMAGFDDVAPQKQDVVERVARVIAGPDADHSDGGNPPKKKWQYLISDARAAIAAMRWPASEVDIAVGAKAVRGVFDLSLVGPDVGFKPEDVAAAVAKAWGLRPTSMSGAKRESGGQCPHCGVTGSALHDMKIHHPKE